MPYKWSNSQSSLLSHTDDTVGGTTSVNAESVDDWSSTYRLYKRRFVGLFGLCILNIVAAMSLPWFGPIATSTSKEFNITLDQVNWLANIISFVYLLSTVFIPWIVTTFGLRRCCEIGGICLIMSGWIRYSSTINNNDSTVAYFLLLSGQFFSAISQSILQVLATKYSEAWFDQNERTTATMIISVSNPIGTAVGQVLSPLFANVRQSILVLAIMSSCAAPFVFLIGNKPPTPPAPSADQKAKSFPALLLDTIGKPRKGEEFPPMTSRQRFDFLVITILFGINVAAINTFSILSSQDLTPYNYTEDISGLMGATLLLAGIVGAGITAPLFDRVFPSLMGPAVKFLVPALAGAWISLIWAIRPNNTVMLFVVFGLVGACGVTLLPIALELAVEQTGAADASSAILWFSANAFTIIFILSESALKAGRDASPPFNMRNGLIFQACIISGLALLVIPFKGELSRRTQMEAGLAAVKTDESNIPIYDGQGDDCIPLLNSSEALTIDIQ